jgi:hypothetical protein
MTGRAARFEDRPDEEIVRAIRARYGEWRTITVQIPPEDPCYPDGWWVHTETGACMNGSLRPVPVTDEMRAHDAEVNRALGLDRLLGLDESQRNGGAS